MAETRTSIINFLNRNKERQRLNSLFECHSGTFAAIYGRRRCGKSRLLTEVLPEKNSVYYICDQRDSSLQIDSLADLISNRLPSFNNVRYIGWDSILERWYKEASSGSILVFDEFPYLVAKSPELPSILQKLIDSYKTKPLHLVICGSSQHMMQGLVLDRSTPLYGRADEVINIKPLLPHYITKAFSFDDIKEFLIAYSFWGGIPRYWELAHKYKDNFEALTELALDPYGVLHNEPEWLLAEDLRDIGQASSILSLIGRGCNKVSEIASRLQKPTSSMARPMANLLELGLITKETIFLGEEISSKKSLYKIDDPFLNTWFTFVEPNRSILQLGQKQFVINSIKAKISHHSGLILERMARDLLSNFEISGESFFPGKKWWGAGLNRQALEFDIVSESISKETLLIGEVKLNLSQGDIERIETTLAAKTDLLPFINKYKKIVFILVTQDKQKLKSKFQILDLKDLFGVK